MFLLWHPSLTAINLSYTFPILETSATALCGTTGRQASPQSSSNHQYFHSLPNSWSTFSKIWFRHCPMLWACNTNQLKNHVSKWDTQRMFVGDTQTKSTKCNCTTSTKINQPENIRKPMFSKKHVFPFNGLLIVSACSSWCLWRKLCSS